MKKLILAIAVAGLVMSCKKPPAGGNLSVLKLNDTPRYSDDKQGETQETASTEEAKVVTTDSAAVKPTDSAEAKH